MPAIAGFLGLGFIDEGEFEEVMDYPRVPFGLGAYDLGTFAEAVPGPAPAPIGQAMTHAGIFTEEVDGTLLLTFGLVPPHTTVPAVNPGRSPRLYLLASIEHAVNATQLGADSSLIIEPGEPVGTIDGQVATAMVRLTAVDGALVIGGLTKEERSAEQVRKLAATRARKAAARQTFLERDRLMARRTPATTG